MSYLGIQQSAIRRYSRLILVLFVISWINLVIQAPVHASMKQQAAALVEQGIMPCHCPTTLCDTVLNLEDQSSEAVHFISDSVADFQIAYVLSVFNHYQQSITPFEMRRLATSSETFHPPPLEVTRILLI